MKKKNSDEWERGVGRSRDNKVQKVRHREMESEEISTDNPFDTVTAVIFYFYSMKLR